MWKHLHIFVNAENLTDQKWGSIYTGSITKPDFAAIYAPLGGLLMQVPEFNLIIDRNLSSFL